MTPLTRRTSIRRAPAAVAALVVGLLLGGCAAQPESRLDEFLEQSRALALETAELAPQDPAGTVVDRGAEARIGDTSSAAEGPSAPAWAQARAYVDYGVAPGASEAAMAAVSAQLTADGWTQSRVREVDGQITEGFRRTIDDDRWYIEIQWEPTAPGLNENLDILVVSPPTTRGDTKVP